MPKTLADARIRLRILATAPVNPEAVTVAAANAGIKAENRILKSDFKLGATNSDTVNDAELSSEGNAVTYGAGNYEGSMTPFRFLDEDGAPDDTADVVFEALREKGATVWILKSIGKHHTDAFVAGDEYELYEVVPDNYQDPSDRGGFIKQVVPLGVQNAYRNLVLVA